MLQRRAQACNGENRIMSTARHCSMHPSIVSSSHFQLSSSPAWCPMHSSFVPYSTSSFLLLVRILVLTVTRALLTCSTTLFRWIMHLSLEDVLHVFCFGPHQPLSGPQHLYMCCMRNCKDIYRMLHFSCWHISLKEYMHNQSMYGFLDDFRLKPKHQICPYEFSCSTWNPSKSESVEFTLLFFKKQMNRCRLLFGYSVFPLSVFPLF